MCSSVCCACVSCLLFHCFTYLYVHVAAHATPVRLSATTIIVSELWFKTAVGQVLCQHSGLPSERINLSPFTKDFRGGGHFMSLI